jgi:transposase
LTDSKAALATPRDKGADARDAENKELRKKVAELERALGRKTYELEVAGELSRDWT